MTPTSVIWIHSLVALLFCGVAVTLPRPDSAAPVARWLLTAAAVATALWALAIAGIGSADVAARVTGALRDLAWLAVLGVAARAGQGIEAPARLGAYAATASCFVLAAGTAIAAAMVTLPEAVGALDSTGLSLRMLGSVGALVLMQRALLGTGEQGGGARHVLLAALALMWTTDLVVYLLAFIIDGWPPTLTIARGAVMVVVAPLVMFAAQQGDAQALRASRTVALRAAAAVLAGLYVLATGIVTGYLGSLAGNQARIVQTAFVFGSAASVLTLASTPWLRGWAKVVVTKHLFRHRYDYRNAWLRFTETLGGDGGKGATLTVRVVTALAELTESPAGLLLTSEAGGLRARAAWRCEAAPDEAGSAALARYLERTARVIDLPAVAAGRAPAEEAALVPAWMTARADGWALVPLLHARRLIGAIMLAPPPVSRALDWEDFDLLGVAGRQVASYLAEDEAHGALGEAQRFDEFNRRFAFILHDLKNLVSQMALVARNAERHADNPEFRADMIATLRDSSQRMTALLARLSQRQAGAAGERHPVGMLALAERRADARRAQHPLRAEGHEAMALADPAALETVLCHLIQNAVEASAAGQPVTLVVGGEGDEVFIDVIDQGGGMSADFVRDGLFRPFVSSKPSGFGLGAFEARQLVEAMGGRLLVTSREGEGSRFRIALPRARALEAAA